MNAAIFLSDFMLTDPSTSPSRARDQLWFGALAAVASAVTFIVVAGLWYLLAGLLAANAWWAWRRTVLSAAGSRGGRREWAGAPHGN